MNLADLIDRAMCGREPCSAELPGGLLGDAGRGQGDGRALVPGRTLVERLDQAGQHQVDEESRRPVVRVPSMVSTSTIEAAALPGGGTIAARQCVLDR